MDFNRLVIAVGCVISAYWVMFYAFVFQDWYLYNPLADSAVKLMLPLALLADIAGVILGCVIAVRERLRGIMVIALYGAPLLVGAGFLWWLCFGVKI